MSNQLMPVNSQASSLVQKCREQEELIERLKLREAALSHRLFLAESISTEAASKLGISLQEAEDRDVEALQGLQDKVAEVETLEYQRTDLIRYLLHTFRQQNQHLQESVSNEIAECQADVSHLFQGTLMTVLHDLKNQVENVKYEASTLIHQEIASMTDMVSQEMVHRENFVIDRSLELMSSVCELADINWDPTAFRKALIHDDSDAEIRDATKLRFLNTCTLTRIRGLEKALEEAQNAEARAKRVALKVAQKRDQELESERAKVQTLSQRLEIALEALEKAKTDFENVSVVVNELNKKADSS